VSLAATPDPVKAKSNLTYTITVKNSGPAAAGDVTVTDPVPDGAVFVSASPTQGTCVTPAPNSAGVMNCTVGTLAPGAQAAITLVVNVITTGKQTVSNTASTSYASDSNPANNSATISTKYSVRSTERKGAVSRSLFGTSSEAFVALEDLDRIIATGEIHARQILEAVNAFAMLTGRIRCCGMTSVRWRAKAGNPLR
jgi:uncharacterized repeat protein (TIGR01451 family)